MVELQTNFGGGKTHSMLALYHMAGGTPVEDLPGLDQLLSREGLTVPGKVNRAVLGGHVLWPLGMRPNGREIMGGRSAQHGANWRTNLGARRAMRWWAENDVNGIAPGSEPAGGSCSGNAVPVADS